jgi:hypothetical protein
VWIGLVILVALVAAPRRAWAPPSNGWIPSYTGSQLGVQLELPTEAKNLAEGDTLVGKVRNPTLMDQAGLPIKGIDPGDPTVFLYGDATNGKLAVCAVKGQAGLEADSLAQLASQHGLALPSFMAKGAKVKLKQNLACRPKDPKKLALAGLKEAKEGDFIYVAQLATRSWRLLLLRPKYTAKIAFRDNKWKAVK